MIRISEIIVYAILVISGAFSILGGIGLIRLPDFYNRTHAATIVSMGGMTLALIALIIHTMITSFWNIFSAKLLLLIILNALANPTATHVISNLAYRKGIKPKRLAKNDWKIKVEES